MSEEKTPWQKRMEGKSDEERKEILAEYGWEIKREWNGKYAEEDTDGDGFLDPIMENVYYYYGEEREDNEYYNWLKTAEMLYNLGWEVFLDENGTQMYYYYKDPSAMPNKAIYQDRNTGQYVVDNQYFDTKAEAEAYIENTPEGVQYVTPAWLNSAGDIVYRNKDNPGEPEKKFIPEGYVRGKDNIWRRYGGAEEMFYDPRARRPTFAGQVPFTVDRPRRRMSQQWNPMMGDRPASIVTGAGERRAYQGMPYYRYGPNYYDERGYTTGGYTGRGALPSMRPQRGTAPVPITKHDIRMEPEGGYPVPGVAGDVQWGEHQHHPETDETIFPWLPPEHGRWTNPTETNPDYVFDTSNRELFPTRTDKLKDLILGTAVSWIPIALTITYLAINLSLSTSRLNKYITLLDDAGTNPKKIRNALVTIKKDLAYKGLLGPDFSGKGILPASITAEDYAVLQRHWLWQQLADTYDPIFGNEEYDRIFRKTRPDAYAYRKLQLQLLEKHSPNFASQYLQSRVGDKGGWPFAQHYSLKVKNWDKIKSELDNAVKRGDFDMKKVSEQMDIFDLTEEEIKRIVEQNERRLFKVEGRFEKLPAERVRAMSEIPISEKGMGDIIVDSFKNPEKLNTDPDYARWFQDNVKGWGKHGTQADTLYYARLYAENPARNITGSQYPPDQNMGVRYPFFETSAVSTRGSDMLPFEHRHASPKEGIKVKQHYGFYTPPARQGEIMGARVMRSFGDIMNDIETILMEKRKKIVWSEVKNYKYREGYPKRAIRNIIYYRPVIEVTDSDGEFKYHKYDKGRYFIQIDHPKAGFIDKFGNMNGGLYPISQEGISSRNKLSAETFNELWEISRRNNAQQYYDSGFEPTIARGKKEYKSDKKRIALDKKELPKLLSLDTNMRIDAEDELLSQGDKTYRGRQKTTAKDFKDFFKPGVTNERGWLIEPNNTKTKSAVPTYAPDLSSEITNSEQLKESLEPKAKPTPEAKPKNAFEAKVSRDAKLDILTDYEIQRRADEAELEELNRKVTAERAAQPKDIVPPFSEQRRQYFKEQARLSQEAWRGREWIRDRLPKQPLLSQPDWVITDEKIENLRRRKIEANRLAAKLPSTRAEKLLAFPETKISPDIDAPKVQEYQPNQYTRKLIDLYEKYTKDPGKWVTETSPAEVGETGGVQTQTRRWQPQPPGIRREPLMSLNQFEQAYGQDIRRLMESEDRKLQLRRLQDIQIEEVERRDEKGKKYTAREPRPKQIPTSLFQAEADAEARRAYYDAALPESERRKIEAKRIIADLEAKIGRRLPYLPFEERARLISEIMEPRSDAREWLDRRQRLLERTRMPKEAFPSPRSYGPFRPQHKIPPLGPFEWDRPLQSRSPDTPKHLWGKTAYRNVTQQEWIKQANEKQLLEWIEYEATKRGPKAATKTRRAIPASQYYGIDVDRFKKLIAEHKKANPNIRMDYVATLEQLKSERDLRQKDIDRIVELKEAQAQVNLEQKLVDAKDFKSLYYSDKNNLEQMGAGKKTYTLWNAQGSEGKWFDSDWQDIKRRGDAGEKLTGENLKRYNAYKEFWKPQSQLTRFNVWITHRTNLIARVDIPEAARGAPDPTSEMERWYYDLEDLSKEEKLRMFEKHHNARLTEIGMEHKIRPDEAKPKTQPKPKPTTPKPPTSTSVERVPRGGDVISRYPLRQTLPEPHTYDWPASKLEAFENLTGRERGRRPLPRFNVFTDEAPSRGRLSALEHALGVPPAPKPLEPGPPSFRRMDPAYEGWGGEVGRRISSSRPYRWGQWALSEGTMRKPGGARLLAPVAGAHALEELVEDSPLEPYDKDLGPFKLSQALGAVGGFAAPHVSFGAEIGQHYYGDWLHRPGSPLSEEQAQWAGAGIGAASMFWGPAAAATLSVPAVEGTWWAGKQIGERANLGAYLGEKYYGEPEEPEKMPKGKGYFGTPKQ